MKRLVLLVALISLLVGGCASTAPIVRGSKVVLPDPPKNVAVDSGKVDKSKYPETTWVKPPKLDLNKRRGYWGFEDIEKISNALTEWPAWYEDVDEIVTKHNESIGAEQVAEQKKWWQLW